MGKNKTNVATVNVKKKNPWGSPYTFGETLGWLVRNGFGPSKKNALKISYIPFRIENNSIKKLLTQEYGLDAVDEQKYIRYRYRIGAIGDIMEMRGNIMEIGENIINFLDDCDYIISNFEGTIVPDQIKKPNFSTQRHSISIINALKNLKDPHKIYLSVANNHAGDFGEHLFRNSIDKLRKQGFNVFGEKDKPYIDINEHLRVVTGTKWSNFECNYINFIDDPERILNLRDPNKFNIFFPHWGYEMELFPRKEIVLESLNYLEQFNIIIGHHSHVPQPISLLRTNNTLLNHEIKDNQNKGKMIFAPSTWENFEKPIAFSLGDFCSGLNITKYKYGLIVKFDVFEVTDKDLLRLLESKNYGKYIIKEINWSFTINHFQKHKKVPTDKTGEERGNTRPKYQIMVNLADHIPWLKKQL
ncbi:MAG: CapA family protein [Promethearchaeota archaeon]